MVGKKNVLLSANGNSLKAKQENVDEILGFFGGKIRNERFDFPF